MKKILLIVHTKTFFPRMFELGQLISRSEGYFPIFHLAYKSSWNNISDDIKILEDHNFEISNDTKRFSISQRKKNENKQEKKCLYISSQTKFFITEKIKHKFYFSILHVNKLLFHNNFFSTFFKIKKRLLQVHNILKEEKSDIIIMSNDVPTWDTGVFIKSAQIEKIPTIVFFSQTGPLDEMMNVASRKWDLSTYLPLNFILGKIYRNWVNKRSGKKFLMMGFGETLAKELLAVTMPQPWIESSSNADAVLIENEMYLERGLQAGLKANNLYLTGQPFHDVIFSTLKKKEENLSKIYSMHELTPNKPIILTSLLPEYQGRDNAGIDFNSYSEMVEFWMKSLISYSDYHTILSLHPSQRYTDYSYVEKWGAKISRLPISEIIPLCYVFVASLSSTITMAIACGKPVINYDFAHYGNTHYDNAPGVLKVKKKDEFKEVIERILCNNAYYQETTSLQHDQAKRWGVIDGNAGNRIIQLMNTLTEKKI